MQPARASSPRRATAAIAGVVFAAALVPVVPAETARAAGPTLFFSEYVEGSGDNRALEIHNPTATLINLGASRYFVLVYPDGSTGLPPDPLPIGIPLVGSIAPGDVHVVAHADADPTIPADQRSAALTFDGDDAIALVVPGNLPTDSIGRRGEDPGTAWGSGPTSTLDTTLRRKAGIVAGDTDLTDPFDPAAEWNGFGLDAFDGLGHHGEPVQVDCGVPLALPFGEAAARTLTASDADGRVVGLSLGAVTPDDPGTFAIGPVTPAAAVGGAASAELSIDAATPSGAYTVTVLATNDDAAPQSGSCVLEVTVEDAPPPPPPAGFDALRIMLAAFVEAGEADGAKAQLLAARIDRAERFAASGQTDAAAAQLRALGNQANGLAPRFLTVEAAAALTAAADLAAE